MLLGRIDRLFFSCNFEFEESETYSSGGKSKEVSNKIRNIRSELKAEHKVLGITEVK